MGDIKKVALHEDLTKLKESLTEAIEKSAKQVMNYNATTIELKLREALEQISSANGDYNSTTRAYIDEIHEAVVDKGT